jgi:hypothetical protein
VASQGGHTWLLSATMSFKKTSSGVTKYSDKKTLRSKEVHGLKKLQEPMFRCKHLFICSGATLIKSIVYTSDKMTRRKKNTYLIKVAKVEPTTKCKYSAVASGATSIGSAGRAPDEI